MRADIEEMMPQTIKRRRGAADWGALQAVARDAAAAVDTSRLDRVRISAWSAHKISGYREQLADGAAERWPKAAAALARLGISLPRADEKVALSNEKKLEVLAAFPDEAAIAVELEDSVSADRLTAQGGFEEGHFFSFFEEAIAAFEAAAGLAENSLSRPVVVALFILFIRENIAGKSARYRGLFDRARPDLASDAEENRPKKLIGLRTTPPAAQAFDEAAERMGMNRSDFITWAALEKARELGVEFPETFQGRDVMPRPAEDAPGRRRSGNRSCN